MQILIAAVIASLATAGALQAQGRGGQDWTTHGADAQRSSWIRSDAKISAESMKKTGFQFLWKVKLNNEARQLNALTAPALLTSYIGYRGFRSLGFVGGSGDHVFALDTDLGRIEWQKHFTVAAAPAGTMACPGGMTANLARPSVAAFPGAPQQGGRGGGAGRGGAKSGVGAPGEGGVTLLQVNNNAGRGPAPVIPPPGTPGGRAGRGAAPGGGGGFGRGVSLVYAISSDGMLHGMYVSNGEEPNPPIAFLPAGAHAQGLIVVDNVAYAATTQGCGGAANGLWAVDIASKAVTSWKSNSGNVAGSSGAAVGPDGVLYVATDGGELAALEPKTLALKEVYKSGGSGFTSTPVVFQFGEKTLIAASTRDGRVHLMDAAALAKPLATAPANAGADFTPGALASWQDSAGTRWLLAPTANAIAAWKVVDQNGAPSLQAGWVAGNMASPLTPMIVNGVVFALSSGAVRNDGKMTAAQIAQRSSAAVLHALDSATGKELWSSGKTITSFVPGGGLSAGGSQMYVGTYDGTLYAFGFWIEH